MTPAVNIVDVKESKPDVPYTITPCEGGASTTYHSYPVCRSEIYLRARPASTSQGWTEVKGTRWRLPTAWNHESVLIKFNGAGFRYVIQRTQAGACTRRATDVAPNFTDLPVSEALFRNNVISLSRFRIGPELNSLVSRAEVKALEKLKLADAELGETFAQWRQTARLVTDNTNRIRRSWKIFSTKNPKAAKQIRQGCFGCSASQLWLELVYGWIPLLQDIYDSIQVLSDTTSKQGMVVRVRGSATDVTSDSGVIGPIYSPFAPGFSVPGGKRITLTTNHRVGVILWYKLDNAQLRSFNSLGLINPASLRWNLIPYSFLLDWLLPIGPWLASFSADAGFEFLTGTKSYKREVRQLIPTDRPIETAYNYVSGPKKTIGYVSVEANYFRRTVYQSRPVPGLYFKNPLSPIHVLNALALLRQAFK